MNTRYLGHVFLIRCVLVFNSPLKYHINYLFSLLSRIDFQGDSDSICLQWIDEFQVSLCLPWPSLLYSEVFHHPLVAGAAKNLKNVDKIFCSSSLKKNHLCQSE